LFFLQDELFFSSAGELTAVINEIKKPASLAGFPFH